MADTATQSQNILWVSPDGSANATGSADDAFASISAALQHAEPGTIIKVAAGDYTESVLLTAAMSGTQDNPIIIEAADGPGTVTLTGANENRSTILIEGASNITIKDMTIVGVGSQTSRDDAPIKIISKDGDVPSNVVIQGNTITGQGRDAIKLAMVDNVTIQNNTIDGDFGQEIIDLFSVLGGQIIGNTISGKCGYAAICAKAGTSDINIESNLFNGDFTYTIKLGGQVDDDPNHPSILLSLERNPGSLQAEHINVLNNIMTASAETDLKIRGATDIHVEGNYFGSIAETANGMLKLASIIVSDMELGTFRESFADNINVLSNITNRLNLLNDKANAADSSGEATSVWDLDAANQLLADCLREFQNFQDERFGNNETPLAEHESLSGPDTLPSVLSEPDVLLVNMEASHATRQDMPETTSSQGYEQGDVDIFIDPQEITLVFAANDTSLEPTSWQPTAPTQKSQENQLQDAQPQDAQPQDNSVQANSASQSSGFVLGHDIVEFGTNTVQVTTNVDTPSNDNFDAGHDHLEASHHEYLFIQSAENDHLVCFDATAYELS